jgi:hypothetical protein
LLPTWPAPTIPTPIGPLKGYPESGKSKSTEAETNGDPAPAIVIYNTAKRVIAEFFIKEFWNIIPVTLVRRMKQSCVVVGTPFTRWCLRFEKVTKTLLKLG